MVRDGPGETYGPNQLLVNPGAEYGDMDGFLSMLTPTAIKASLDFRDCFSRWLAPRRIVGYWGFAIHYRAFSE